MKKSKTNQRMTAITLVLALGVAVYLNWQYAKAGGPETQPVQASAPVSTPAEQPKSDAPVVLDPLAAPASAEAAVDKNYGEAQLVSINEKSSDEFFESARLSRSKTRDEALDTLQKSLKSAKLSEDEKKELTDKLSAQIKSMTAENEIESLVKAKGFVDCVAFINDDQVNITVMTSSEGLTKEEVAQIRDIVLSKCSVTAQNIIIVEVK